MNYKDIYENLMDHLSHLSMGYPPRENLLEMLKEMFNPLEAKIILTIPSKTIPFKTFSLQELSQNCELPLDELEKILENLSKRGLLYSSKDTNEESCYAFHQNGFGFPQTFFWKGEDTPYSRSMAKNTIKYLNTEVTKEVYCTKPIPFRFVPVDETIEPGTAAVLPYQVMEQIIKKARVISVAQCNCRVVMKLVGKGCDHPTEVCMKFNDLAQYMIEKGFARRISVEEALKISKQASEYGLVHFTDNVIEDIQQNCNCCGCSCWNLGRIRRRMIPRDEIIATYFIRKTLIDKCVGCGNCIDICPTDAVKLEDNAAIVDDKWCIGCGVCALKCPNDAINIALREDLKDKEPESNFQTLHRKILEIRK